MRRRDLMYPAGMLIDPHLFTDEAVTDETRQFNAGLQEMLLAVPDMTTFTPDEIRSARREGKSWMGPIVYSDRARTITIDGPGGDLDLRIIDAPEPAGVYLHLHGGGWVLGAADLSDVDRDRRNHPTSPQHRAHTTQPSTEEPRTGLW